RNDAYSIQALYLPVEQRQLSPEQIFDGRFTQGDQYGFRVSPIAQGGSYDASEQVGAGYAMVEYALGERVKLVGGARLERTATAVTAQPTIGAAVFTNPTYTDVLPSAAANVKVTETQNLRLSVSQTLSRPEYRELAEVQYRDVIGGENVLGNPALRRTLIRNADVRWEWYPDAGEVLSVGVFAKRFEDPIERVYLATSGTRMVTFVNARAANNVGVELEARKNLGFVADALMPLTVFSNLTLMRSRIELGSDPRVAPEERPMMGQAPYVVNAGLTYADEDRDMSATILYNRMGRRIVAASQQPLPTTYEEARDVLDVSLRFPVVRGLSARLDAKNLLDAPYLQTQGPVTRESYLVGRSFGFGLSWQP
ncbi:MAG: TonB-dependent receptor domain-containing protein, partial [Gemmatimonadaceae bacterium]